MAFAVITPTIGTGDLEKCIESVRKQDCNHHLFVDGREHLSKVEEIVERVAPDYHRVAINVLDFNIGKGWYGHRVYAAAAYLLNEDVLCYLDEDNWIEPNYIQAFKDVLENPENKWAYTLRRIMSPEGEYICDDNCESLGHHHVLEEPTRFHIDTGCFAVPRELALRVGHNWYGQWGQDRKFFQALKAEAPEFGSTLLHTLNYRLGGSTSMATKDMFLRGNELASEVYKGEYPWHTKKSNRSSSQFLSYHTTSQKRLS